MPSFQPSTWLPICYACCDLSLEILWFKFSKEYILALLAGVGQGWGVGGSEQAWHLVGEETYTSCTCRLFSVSASAPGLSPHCRGTCSVHMPSFPGFSAHCWVLPFPTPPREWPFLHYFLFPSKCVDSSHALHLPSRFSLLHLCTIFTVVLFRFWMEEEINMCTLLTIFDQHFLLLT